MLTEKNIKLLSISILIICTIFHALTLNYYPAPFPDDALWAARAKAFMQTGSPIGQLDLGAYDQIKDASHTFYRIPLYLYQVGINLFSTVSIESVRFINIFFIVALFSVTYLIGVYLGSSLLGALAAYLLAISVNFSLASHVARPDIFSCFFAISSFLLIIRAPVNKYFAAIIAALLFFLAFETHPRCIIYFPLMMYVYLVQNGKKIFFAKNFWLFNGLLGGLILLDYIFLVQPYLPAFTRVAEISVGASRTPPILKADLILLFNSLSGLLKLIWSDHPIYLLSIIEILLLIKSPELKQRILLGIGLTVFGIVPALVVNSIPFNSIMFLPLLALLTASFVFRVFSNLKFSPAINRFLKIGISFAILHASYLNVNDISESAIIKTCSQDFSDSINFIKDRVGAQERMLGTDTFWFGFQEQKYYSWTIILSLMRLKKISLAEALKELKPDVIVMDGRMSMFIRKTSASNTLWLDNMSIDADAFTEFLNQHLVKVDKRINTCAHDLEILRLEWNRF